MHCLPYKMFSQLTNSHKQFTSWIMSYEFNQEFWQCVQSFMYVALQLHDHFIYSQAQMITGATIYMEFTELSSNMKNWLVCNRGSRLTVSTHCTCIYIVVAAVKTALVRFAGKIFGPLVHFKVLLVKFCTIQFIHMHACVIYEVVTLFMRSPHCVVWCDDVPAPWLSHDPLQDLKLQSSRRLTGPKTNTTTIICNMHTGYGAVKI